MNFTKGRKKIDNSNFIIKKRLGLKKKKQMSDLENTSLPPSSFPKSCLSECLFLLQAREIGMSFPLRPKLIYKKSAKCPVHDLHQGSNVSSEDFAPPGWVFGYPGMSEDEGDTESAQTDEDDGLWPTGTLFDNNDNFLNHPENTENIFNIFRGQNAVPPPSSEGNDDIIIEDVVNHSEEELERENEDISEDELMSDRFRFIRNPQVTQRPTTDSDEETSDDPSRFRFIMNPAHVPPTQPIPSSPLPSQEGFPRRERRSLTPPDMDHVHSATSITRIVPDPQRGAPAPAERPTQQRNGSPSTSAARRGVSNASTVPPHAGTRPARIPPESNIVYHPITYRDAGENGEEEEEEEDTSSSEYQLTRSEEELQQRFFSHPVVRRRIEDLERRMLGDITYTDSDEEDSEESYTSDGQTESLFERSFRELHDAMAPASPGSILHISDIDSEEEEDDGDQEEDEEDEEDDEFEEDDE